MKSTLIKKLLIHHFNDDYTGCVYFQETTVTESEVHCQTLLIGTQRQGEQVTFALRTPTPEDTRRWNQAISRHVHNMSEASASGRSVSSCPRVKKVFACSLNLSGAV